MSSGENGKINISIKEDSIALNFYLDRKDSEPYMIFFMTRDEAKSLKMDLEEAIKGLGN